MVTPSRSKSLELAQPRVLRHHVRAFDVHVGVGEFDVGRARRVDREEADVPRALLHRVRELAGGLERHEAYRYADPTRELAGQRRTDAARIAAVRIPLCDDRIAEIDAGTQDSGWRKLRAQRFGDRRSPAPLARSAATRFSVEPRSGIRAIETFDKRLRLIRGQVIHSGRRRAPTARCELPAKRVGAGAL